MPGSYSKDAYKPIYKHSTWKKEAKSFESSLATALYKDAKVKQSAQTALVRLANVLNAYYENGDEAQEEKLSEAGAIGQVAAEITGEKDPMEEIPKVANEMSDSPTSSDVEGADESYDGETAEPSVEPQQEQSFMDDEAEETSAVTADSTPYTGYDDGEAPPSDVGNNEAEGAVDASLITPTVTHAFLKNMSSSAGQVGLSEDESTNQENVQAIMGEDGNLREKMTMMFNAVLLNGGMTQEETSNSTSFKRVVRDVQKKDVANHKGLQGLNMKAIKKVQGKKADVMDMARLSTSSGFSPKRLISSLFGLKARQSRDKETDGKTGGLGYQYYKTNGIKLSSREKAFAVKKTQEGDTKQHDLSWREGKAYWKIKKNSYWARSQAKKGRILTAGPSGTTARMLSSYKFLGATEKELLEFRLALMGWMITSQDHSLYEIFAGSHLVGVKGKENLKEAAEMYRTIDPLTIEEIRAAAVDGELPHEHVLHTMLQEVAKARVKDQKAAGANYNDGSLNTDLSQWNPETGHNETRKMSAQEKSINIYTTEAYKIMNFGQVAGNKVARWRMKQLAKEESIESQMFYNSDDKQLLSDDTNKQIFNALRASNRVSGEAFDEYKENTQTDKSDQVPSEGKKFYNGTVFRGTSVVHGARKFKKVGNTSTFSSLTSTSKEKGIAYRFLGSGVVKGITRSVLLEIDTQGLAGIDISKLSGVESEEEVLIPAGTKLVVTEPERKVAGTRYSHVKLKVAGTPTPKSDNNTEDTMATDLAPTAQPEKPKTNNPSVNDTESTETVSQEEAAVDAMEEDTLDLFSTPEFAPSFSTPSFAPSSYSAEEDDDWESYVGLLKLAELQSAATGMGGDMDDNISSHPDLTAQLKGMLGDAIVRLVEELSEDDRTRVVLKQIGVNFTDEASATNVRILSNLYFNYTYRLRMLSQVAPDALATMFESDFMKTIKEAVES